jgi:SAM-dependent methyltransferase
MENVPAAAGTFSYYCSMFDFHKDKKRYFEYQYLTSRDYILPFIQPFLDSKRPLQVLEIGCAEAGVLKAFTEQGHQCLGIELMEGRLELAREFMEEEMEKGLIRFINKNIYDIEVEKDIGHRFDLILLKDVIEHIPRQDIFINKLLDFLKPGGKVFFAFPPWYMPFGGHQQLCRSKILSKLPYYHLLPMPVYKGVLKAFGEPESVQKDLEEIKTTGISIERFERIARKDYRILRRELFLFNPIYKYKFNLQPRVQYKVIRPLPYVRDFLSTCAYYLIAPK